MRSVLSLAELREKFRPQSSREVFSFSRFSEGILRGGLSQFFGSGRLELAAQFLAEHPDQRVAWIESRFELYPWALWQRRVQLKQCTFVETGIHLEWSILQTLKSQAFAILIVDSGTRAGDLDLLALKRIQLAAEKSHCAVILLNELQTKMYPISLHFSAVNQ